MKLPQKGIRVIEFEGNGPEPLAGGMLASMGVKVTVIAKLVKGGVNAQPGMASDNPQRHCKTQVLRNRL